MHIIGTSLKLGLGVAVSVGALVAASNLGATGHAEAADGAKIFAAVIAGSLLHIPAAFLMSAVHMAADGMEHRLAGIGQADRPVANEDVKRAGRRAAVRGVKVAVHRFFKSAKADPLDHDLILARRFRRNALEWVDAQVRATRRKDRPSSGGWNQPGLGYEGVLCCDPPEDRVQAIEAAAWLEFTTEMARKGVRIPEAFRDHFIGGQNCGLGWRRAGHLLFMRELKDNHDAFVGFVVDALLARHYLENGRERAGKINHGSPPLKPKQPGKVASPVSH